MKHTDGDAFVEYFKALHGYEPFPWQARLAARMLNAESWPNLLDVPTGLGKTSIVDVALFVLASRPKQAPRRIVLVIDRRVVVDQAAHHARRIQSKLTVAKQGVLASVAAALRELWGGADNSAPFEVAVLRGGMPRDESWTKRPDRPVVAVSTVDQVGSRLLFRGYGVSAGMAPVHAGLLGNDTLLLLDEVQLSTAFAETLQAVQDRWRSWRENGASKPEVPNRWAFMRMSATPVGSARADEVRFGLDETDLTHPIVAQRRSARKLATLCEPIPTSRSDAQKSQQAVVTAFATATEQSAAAGSRRIVVIVNRVATARHVHDELKTRLEKQVDVVLLTGRMRPLDRIRIFGEADQPGSVAARVTAGLPRTADDRPVVVVSTQTIEAGADFDFDALVTECASIDALRQRFGRLDRRGEQGQTRATVLIRKDQAAESADDPVYGAALARTWTWLEARAGADRVFDFGIASFPALEPAELAELCSPVQHAPVMLPAHLDAWAQTNPRGEPDPDVSLWLHGPERGTAEVRVVWRGDIDEDMLSDDAVGKTEAYASASLALAPPSSLESISVPLPAFRAWLERESPVELADVEGSSSSLAGGSRRRDGRRKQGRPFLVVGRTGAEVQRSTSRLLPESTVVVPATYGGIRYGNWDPDGSEPVTDLGDLAQLVHRGRPVLRLHPALFPSQPRHDGSAALPARNPTGFALAPAAVPPVPQLPSTDDPEFKPVAAVREWLDRSRAAGASDWQMLVDALTQQGSKLRVLELAASRSFAAIARRRSGEQLDAFRQSIDVTSDIVNDDDDGASHIGREVGLEQHLEDVERWTRNFANHLGLPETIADDLAFAARLHDIGKADPRFQQMLHGGSPVRAAASKILLAKSRADAGDRAAREQARKRADYPTGYRHELLSVAMLGANHASLAEAHDPELVLHLVGSHHGWCRPFAPAVDPGPSFSVDLSVAGAQFSANAAHDLASVDSGIADRYWLLTERYGWWVLAWFEALVRLADHRASEESARAEKDVAGATARQGGSA